MTEIKHTPGPWRLRPDDSQCHEIQGIDTGGVWVLRAKAYGGTVEEIEANARLIAVAPELLGVCQWILLPDHPIGSDAEFVRKVQDRARHAIAAAIGEVETLGIVGRVTKP
jgi:hypothetical protein